MVAAELAHVLHVGRRPVVGVVRVWQLRVEEGVDIGGPVAVLAVVALVTVVAMVARVMGRWQLSSAVVLHA